MKWFARALIIVLISVTIAAITGWGVLAIYYSNLPGIEVRKIVALVFALFGAAMPAPAPGGIFRRLPVDLYLVVDDHAAPGSRLGARVCQTRPCEDQRRPGNDSRYQKFLRRSKVSTPVWHGLSQSPQAAK